MSTNLNGLLSALQQSINQAILESHEVAAVLSALKRAGKCPAFTIEIALEERAAESATEPAAGLDDHPARQSNLSDELVLSDDDVEFLSNVGISDPSWSDRTTKAGTA